MASPQLPANGDFFPVKERLAVYPNLQQALADPWAKREESVHPAKSPYALLAGFVLLTAMNPG